MAEDSAGRPSHRGPGYEMAREPHFEIHVQTEFSAAHHLRGYAGDCEKPHGHNWTVDVYVESDTLNETGITIDFRDVKTAVKSVLEQFDHSDLNALALFQTQNPTCENVARHLYKELGKVLNAPSIRVVKVGVSETRECGASYWEE